MEVTFRSWWDKHYLLLMARRTDWRQCLHDVSGNREIPLLPPKTPKAHLVERLLPVLPCIPPTSLPRANLEQLDVHRPAMKVLRKTSSSPPAAASSSLSREDFIISPSKRWFFGSPNGPCRRVTANNRALDKVMPPLRKGGAKLWHRNPIRVHATPVAFSN